MKLGKMIVGVIILAMSGLCLAAEEHHNLTVDTCRAYPTGSLQIRGKSDSDGNDRHITYTTQMFSEKVLDRYLSVCLTAFASGATLRVDYLECTGTTCAPKANTTAMLIK